MPRPLDIWASAIIHCPLDRLDQSALESCRLTWLPQSPGVMAFRADPFGLWRGDELHILIEGFDYRRRRGYIECLTYNDRFEHLATRTVLCEPWHLSYPFLFEGEGETWMLPEARRSGTLRLYRALDFPDRWERAAEIPLAAGAVDSTMVRFEGRWWLFYAYGSRILSRQSRLHCAWSSRIEGPWTAHPLNPVREGLAGTRPAGTPILRAGMIELPVQDSRTTYGGAVRKLMISRLDEDRFEAEEQDWLTPPARLAPFTAGLHTASSAGEVSLIDCKRIDRSWRGAAIRTVGSIERRLGRRAATPILGDR